MKKLFALILFLSSLFTAVILFTNINLTFGQSITSNTVSAAKGWTTNNPFQTDVFVENHGQFNHWVKSDVPVKYAINNSEKILFTNQSVIFRLEKMDNISEEEREQREEEGETDTANRIFFVAMQWEGSNPNAEMMVSEPAEGYYTFGEKGYEQVKAKGFRKLLYKNLYPGIDVEYTLPDKGGIKYNLIVQPGAFVESVKMHYTGDIESIHKDNVGNIVIQTPAGDITDHVPESIFKETNATVPSSFNLNYNIVSFTIQLPTPNSSLHTLIIDPWTITPTSLTNNTAALDIDYDFNNNVYVSGGTTPFKLAKFNNSGVLQWTFTNPSGWSHSNWYSRFCVLPHSGTIFIGESWSTGIIGSRVMKISRNGMLVHTSPYFGTNDEISRMFYNNCSKQLIAFGGGTTNNDNVKIIADTNLSSNISKSFNGFNCTHNDIASVVMDDNGDFFAISTTNKTQCLAIEGRLQKSLFATNYSFPCAFTVPTNYFFREYPTLQGVLGSVVSVRANSLALNSNYLFSYDGKTLKAWNKVNGSLYDSIIVDYGYIGGKNRTHEGIDADECNIVYVGGANKIHIYYFNAGTFSSVASVSTNITGYVHDIKLNRATNKIYICGVGFVTEATVPVSCYIGQITTSFTIDSCKGNICVTALGGTPPYRYLWSNGDTTNCISSVQPGVYTVTVSNSYSCSLLSHVDTITLNPFHVEITSANIPVCLGDTITLQATSNVSSTNFNWSNGSVGSSIKIAPITTATYTVIGNYNSCSDTASVLVTVNPSYQDTLNPVICQGNYYSIGSHTYAINGSYIDTLTTSSGCDSIITTNLTVNPVYDTAIRPVICNGQSFEVGNHVYTVTNTYIDSLSTIRGCDSIITTYLTVITINSTISSPAQICDEESIVLFATGGTSYYWIPPYGLSSQTSSSPLASPDSTTTYYVTITNDPCYKVDSVKVMVTECPAIYFPNSFTPDGDGINDLFMAKGILIESFSMIIFDRWGEEIFTSNNIMQGWDGTYKGEKCSNAVFSYIADIVFTNGEKVNKIGSITLLR